MTTPRVAVGGRSVDELEFIRQLRAHNEEATRLLVRQIKDDHSASRTDSVGLHLLSRSFRPVVLGYLGRDWFPYDAATAQEVWNDTLFRTYSRIESYDPTRSRFLTWVVNQARYAALDARRHQTRREARIYEVPATTDDVTPLSRVEQRALRRARKRLSPLEARLLQLRVVEECAPRDIATQHFGGDLSAEQVRVYTFRAISRLRKHFEDELQEEIKNG